MKCYLAVAAVLTDTPYATLFFFNGSTRSLSDTQSEKANYRSGFRVVKNDHMSRIFLFF